MSRDAAKSSETAGACDAAALAEQMRRDSAPNACLLVISGLDIGRVIPLQERAMTLGCDSACDVVLRDDGVSQRHAELRRDGPDRVVLRDLGSTYGTFVKGQRVRQAVLWKDDKVLMGRRTILKFVFLDALEQRYQRLLYESSSRDALTGTYNRRYFNEKLAADLSFAKRHHMPLALLIFDIDHFKRVNDALGHASGDRVLIAIARAVREIIRAEDTLARWGGEEFAVIAQGTGLDGARRLGERIRACIQQRDLPAPGEAAEPLRVTLSVGAAAVAPPASATPEAVLAKADASLYQAKRSGRNQVVASELPAP